MEYGARFDVFLSFLISQVVVVVVGNPPPKKKILVCAGLN